MSDDAARTQAVRLGCLAARRKAVGLTQEQLAKQLDVRRTTVLRWELGQTQPQPWLRPKLAKALGVPADGIEQLLAGCAAPAEPDRREAAAPLVPRQLPGAVAGFTGRAAELAELTGMLERAGAGAPGTVVICAIGGTAGAGKTTLALHWAHQVADRFGDGQLHVNLRGFDPTGTPAAPEAVIRGFLDALGVPPERIPVHIDAQAGLYRSLLADRQMLIVLDNARDEQQVRPLLPASPASLVIVTSRNQLAGLAAADGARLLSVDVLTHAEATQLLTARLGPARAAAEPEAVAEIATLCAYLPLALAVAAARAAARPGFPLATLAAELRDAVGRLDALDSGDPSTSVRAVFSWSYQQLSTAAAWMFRLLGMHPGPDFDLYAVAALTGTTLDRARRVLDELARAHLCQITEPGRWGMHNLLYAYAHELAAEDADDRQRQALTRLLDHYLHTSAVAMDALHPAERQRRPRMLPPATPAPAVSTSTAASAWLDAELATLVVVTAYAAERGWPTHATRLSATLFRYLSIGSHYSEARSIHSHARAAARSAGDRDSEAAALNALAGVHLREGAYQEAAAYLQQALALFRQANDRRGQARALHNLGLVQCQLGRIEQADELCSQSVSVFREIGDQYGEAKALDLLGTVHLEQGRYEQAVSQHQQALVLARELGDPNEQACALDNLGAVYLRLGSYEEAADSLRQALDLFRQVGNRIGEAFALSNLGAVCNGQRHFSQAASHLQEALALSRETGERASEAEAAIRLGEVLLATGQAYQARASHSAALDLAGQIGDKYRQARAHDGLGHACDLAGDRDQARRHWQDALTLFTGLGVPEADRIRARLASEGDAVGADRELAQPDVSSPPA
jgi:tetratricopeptide (TPR) repeat protein/transcriptional regulator with XRE-family HTH domain